MKIIVSYTHFGRNIVEDRFNNQEELFQYLKLLISDGVRFHISYK